MVRKYLSKPSIWMKYHRLLTLIFLLALGLHIIDVKIYRFSNLSNLITNTNYDYSDNLDDNTIISKIDIKGELNNYNFKDGTYDGVADAYGPNLTVNVNIRNNIITNIDIVSHNEVGEKHYGKSMLEIPQEIVNKQSIDIDIITGATYTSEGIINAVKDALSKAIIINK